MKNIIIRILIFFEFYKAASWLERTMIFKRIEATLTSKWLLWALGILFVIFMMDQCFKENAKDANNPEYKNDRYFSGWDGSNPELVEYVKAQMNDPGSFEHVETKYLDKGSTLEIYMKYRGKNKFGGVVTEVAVCAFDKATETISDVDIIN